MTDLPNHAQLFTAVFTRDVGTVDAVGGGAGAPLPITDVWGREYLSPPPLVIMQHNV